MTKRVLIIDDDLILGRLAQRVLARPDLEVATVGSLAEARKAVSRDGRPDVVVADIHLPNGDGRHLREELADVPFIIISGFSDEAPDLAKPFSARALREKVQEKLGLLEAL